MAKKVRTILKVQAPAGASLAASRIAAAVRVGVPFFSGLGTIVSRDVIPAATIRASA